MKTPTRTRPASPTAAKKEPVARVMYLQQHGDGAAICYANPKDRVIRMRVEPEPPKPVLVIDLSRKEEVVEVMARAMQGTSKSGFFVRSGLADDILTALERAAKGKGR